MCESEKSEEKNGCKQFVYCSECLAFPMGAGCPNKQGINNWNRIIGKCEESVIKNE